MIAHTHAVCVNKHKNQLFAFGLPFYHSDNGNTLYNSLWKPKNAPIEKDNASRTILNSFRLEKTRAEIGADFRATIQK